MHLCSGGRYIDGFINIDRNPFRKIDMWLDITNGLPFSDNSCKGIYMAMALEHFYIQEVSFVLHECYRVLSEGGSIRILVPSLERAIELYMQNDVSKFSGFPGNFKSTGGRFSSEIICDGQHKVAFDFGFLKEVLLEAGFKYIETREPRRSSFINSEAIEKLEQPEAYTEHAICLIVEATK